MVKLKYKKEMIMNIYDKWETIIESLYDDSVSDNMKNFTCEYAEHHSKIENEKMLALSEHDPVSSQKPISGGDYSANLLPVSLKLLSKLEFPDDIKLRIVDFRKEKLENIINDNHTSPYETFIYSAKIKKSDYTDLKHYGIDVVQQHESLLLEESARDINEKLKNAKTFSVNLMVSEIKIEDDGSDKNTMTFSLKNLIRIDE